VQTGAGFIRDSGFMVQFFLNRHGITENVMPGFLKTAPAQCPQSLRCRAAARRWATKLTRTSNSGLIPARFCVADLIAPLIVLFRYSLNLYLILFL